MVKVIEHRYTPQGGALQLFACRKPEVLMEGPAGTGKTRAVLEYVHVLMSLVPNCRALFTRATRASMTESVLPIYELFVATPACGVQPVGGRRNHVKSYEYPNGSEIVVSGLDRPSRIMSAQYDLVVIFEATEARLDDWEMLITRLRNNQLPMQQAIAECNPDHPQHWLNERANASRRMQRIYSRHEDNPSLTPAYLETLRNLTGVRRDRYYLGKWVAATGQVFENFEPSLHVVDEIPKQVRIKYYVGGVDWGYSDPGVFQVWGVDSDRRMILVEEYYKTKGSVPRFWIPRMLDVCARLDVRAIIADPAEPELIDQCRAAGLPMREADNTFMTGRNAVDDRLKLAGDGLPRMYFLKAAPRCHDDELANLHRAQSVVAEIPGYVWPQKADGKPIKERPDPSRPDHGCDAMRYTALFMDQYDLADALPDKPKYDPGTFGAELGHEELEEQIESVEAGRAEWDELDAEELDADEDPELEGWLD